MYLSLQFLDNSFKIDIHFFIQKQYEVSKIYLHIN
jgi:hypothetical protein